MASSPSERRDDGETFADAARQFDATENTLEVGANAGKRRRGKVSIVERLEEEYTGYLIPGFRLVTDLHSTHDTQCWVY
jgi:hypothetical protein